MFPLTRWHAAWIGVAVLVSTLALVVLWRRHPPPPGPVVLTTGAAPRGALATGPARKGPAGDLFVHVTGQVIRPGLYRLPQGARVMDAITTAGGAGRSADLDALNLATPLRDGQKLFIPAIGEPAPMPQHDYIADSPTYEEPPAPVSQAPPPLLAPEPIPQPVAAPEPYMEPEPSVEAPRPAVASSRSGGDKLRNPGDGVVNINAASEKELTRLPGVGPSTARKILEYRSEHGGFRTVEELMEVRGIGEVKLERMRPFVVLQ